MKFILGKRQNRGTSHLVFIVTFPIRTSLGVNAISDVSLLHKQNKTTPNNQEPVYKILHSQSVKNRAEAVEKFNYTLLSKEWSRLIHCNLLCTRLQHLVLVLPPVLLQGLERITSAAIFPNPFPIWGLIF